jgi:hypothetical protein
LSDKTPHEPSYYIRPDVNASTTDELKGEIKQLSRTITNNTLILAKLEGAIKEEKEKEGERKKNND